MKRQETENFKYVNVAFPSYTGSVFPGDNSELKSSVYLSFVQFQQDELMPKPATPSCSTPPAQLHTPHPTLLPPSDLSHS